MKRALLSLFAGLVLLRHNITGIAGIAIIIVIAGRT